MFASKAIPFFLVDGRYLFIYLLNLKKKKFFYFPLLNTDFHTPTP